MARRKRAATDDTRLRLMWETCSYLSLKDFSQRLTGGETEGDRALLAIIERELTPDELDIVRREVAGSEPAHVLHAIFPRLPPNEEPSSTLHEMANVRWTNKGWIIRSTDEVADLEERRNKRKVTPANPAPKG